MSTADDLWEEMSEDSGEPEGEEQATPDPDEPWAKTSSGDADSMTTD